MNANKTIVRLFGRERKPADLVFAIVFVLFAIFLLVQLTGQTKWLSSKSLFAQPRFWPAVGVIGMTVFGLLHLLGSVLSPKEPGRVRELMFWALSLEYVAWFLLYVFLVPLAGYLPMTVLFAVLLVYRVGYRGKPAIIAAVLSALLIVLVFRVLLQVKIPGGAIYEYLPETIRVFMLSYM